MAFQLNYQNNHELIPEGEYECRIERALESATNRGTPYLDILLRVRQDLEQPGQGRRIDHALWPKKTPEPADQAFGGYSAKQILSLSEAAGLPSGRSYQGFENWCDDLAGRLVRATVYHDAYGGNTRARVRWINATRYPDEDAAQAQPTAGAPFRAAGPAATPGNYNPLPDDDDIPF
jgi:hypothetical protein